MIYIIFNTKGEKKSLLSKFFKKKDDENTTSPAHQSSSSLVNIMASSDVSKFYFTYDYENGTGNNSKHKKKQFKN